MTQLIRLILTLCNGRITLRCASLLYWLHSVCYKTDLNILKSEATSSRTDSSQQGKIISLSKPESQMAATRRQLYRQSQRSASCRQRRPQRQPKASATPLTQFGGKTHPGDEASRRPYKYQGKPEKRG